jgi:hypothetical protein
MPTPRPARRRTPVKPRPRRTSALKAKRISSADLDKLETFLRIFSRSSRAASLLD